MLRRTRYSNTSSHNAKSYSAKCFLKTQPGVACQESRQALGEKVFCAITGTISWLTPSCRPGEQEAGAALTAFLTQEKRSTDLNAAAAELLAAQPEEKGPVWIQAPATNTRAPAAHSCCCRDACREPHITSTSWAWNFQKRLRGGL